MLGRRHRGRARAVLVIALCAGPAAVATGYVDPVGAVLGTVVGVATAGPGMAPVAALQGAVERALVDHRPGSE